MALNVETGTGSETAESYCSVATADAYHTARGITTWGTLTTAQKEQALRRATDYMSEVYRFRWAGYRKTEVQALDWPRYEVPRLDTGTGKGYRGGYRWAFLESYYPDDAVPVEVQRACAMLALKAAAGELAPAVDRIAIREQVGPIEVEYAEGATPWVRFRAVDNSLAGLLKSGSGTTIRLERA